jgi:hypothetical protein
MTMTLNEALQRHAGLEAALADTLEQIDAPRFGARPRSGVAKNRPVGSSLDPPVGHTRHDRKRRDGSPMATDSYRSRHSIFMQFVTANLLLVAIVTLVSSLVARTAGPPDFEMACADDEPYLVTAAFRAKTSAGAAPNVSAASVILFRDTPSNRPHYVLATYSQTGAVWGLAYRPSEAAVYAAAFHKRGLPYGPGGPGGIYRIDLATGAVSLFLTVPDAGPALSARPYMFTVQRAVGSGSAGGA